MRNGTLNILIGGEAGQGLVTIGQLQSRILIRSGYSVLSTQSYMSRIRGGHNSFSIRAGSDSVLAPEETIDLLVALDSTTVALHRKELSPKGMIIADAALELTGDHLLEVPFEKLGKRKQMNVAALGVMNTLLNMDAEVTVRTIEDFFGRKDPKVQEDNRQALEKSIAWAKTIENKTLKLAPVTARKKMLMLSGNECLALGALAAGLKFYSFYPMTPTTGIGQSLAALAKKAGIIVEQGEDEIAALNMALGASFAGAPSMVATSGGGFALMVEAVSLAGMTETPIVIVVGQRPAPATGLPTRTEQADLEFVLHAGHGEFPRAVFAPGTVEDCFFIPGRALALAEKYQSPIFILTDQFVADSYGAVKPFDLKGLTPVKPGADENAIAQPYRRYAITESGVSPRLLPGMSKHLVVADSDEHTEDGHLTEDLSVRKQMVEKRLRKLEGMRREVIPPEFIGDPDPELLLVCWGSTKGSALEAAGDLRTGGRRMGVLHFTQVWPLVQEQFLGLLQTAGQAVCIESNATGQFARLIRRETGFEFKRQIHRYDGLPITPEYILRELKESR